MKLLLLPLLAVANLALMACSGSASHAGGSSEETNALAGILVDSVGLPVANAWVEVRPASDDPVTVALRKPIASVDEIFLVASVWRDTTDKEGRWAVQPGFSGSFTVVAGAANGFRSIHSVVFLDSLQILDTIWPASPLVFKLDLPEGALGGNEVTLPGTRYSAISDSLGMVRFDSLPQGHFDMIMHPKLQARLAKSYWRVAHVGTSKVWGPFSVQGISDSTWAQASVHDGAILDTLHCPYLYEYGVRSWWTFDDLQPAQPLQDFLDTRGHSASGILYGGTPVVGVNGFALSLENSAQFGVIETTGSTFDSLQAFSVELWVRVRALPDLELYQMNLVGQLGVGDALSEDLFSLALVRDSVGAQPHFAFLLSDGNSGALSDSGKVISNSAVDVGEWIYLAATWDGKRSCIYVNDDAPVCRELSISALLKSPEPMYFGKENLHVDLDDVRVIGICLNESDVRYRWLKRFQ